MVYLYAVYFYFPIKGGPIHIGGEEGRKDKKRKMVRSEELTKVVGRQNRDSVDLPMFADRLCHGSLSSEEVASGTGNLGRCRIRAGLERIGDFKVMIVSFPSRVRQPGDIHASIVGIAGFGELGPHLHTVHGHRVKNSIRQFRWIKCAEARYRAYGVGPSQLTKIEC